MPFDPHSSLPEATRRLIRRVAFHTAQLIAEDAQLFAAKLRDGADDISAADAVMAFARKLRAVGAPDGELLLMMPSETAELAGTLH